MENCRLGVPTLQHRLRHLHSVAARNVNVPARHGAADLSSLELYYTLHRDELSPAFYTSEKIRGSSNPTWKTLNLTHMDECCDVDTASQSFTVRVWYCYNDVDSPPRQCVVWHVHLASLVHLANRSLTECAHDGANSLIFGLHGGFYGAPLPPDAATDAVVKPSAPAPEAEQNAARNSYSVRTLQRIQTVLRAIKQTQAQTQRVHRDIDRCLRDRLHTDRKRAQREQSVVKVNMIRGDLQWRLAQLRSRKDALESQQLSNLQKEVSIRNKCEKLNKNKDELQERKKRYFDIRDELIKSGAHLVLRRKQLVYELALIYPIVQVRSGDITFHTICGVRLPQSEEFAGHDETMLSVALGFTCHLVTMIGNYLDIPLRYPMDHRGSRSLIHDHILDKLPDNERDFPLFGKGKEKFQFHYGVYLLNKNIAQLRHYCGLMTQDLRPTLENVCSLLCDKLGVTSNRNDALSSQHSLIPPSFSGPQLSSNSHTLSSKNASNVNSSATGRPIVITTTAASTLSESPSTAGRSLEDIKEEMLTSSAEISSENAQLKSAENHVCGNVAGAAAENLPSEAAENLAIIPQDSSPLDNDNFNPEITFHALGTSSEISSQNVASFGGTPPQDCGTSAAIYAAAMPLAAALPQWDMLRGGIAASDSIASSLGGMLESADEDDVTGLLSRAAAVVAQSTFKTHAMTQRDVDTDVDTARTVNGIVSASKIPESDEVLIEGAAPFEAGSLVDVEPTAAHCQRLQPTSSNN